jgi:hypothetical protein
LTSPAHRRSAQRQHLTDGAHAPLAPAQQQEEDCSLAGRHADLLGQTRVDIAVKPPRRDFD